MIIKKYIFLIILLYFSSLSGQWNISIGNYSSTTSNLINNYKNIEDIYFYPRVQLSRIEQHFTFYYSGSTVKMINNSIYNRDFHELGMNFYKGFTRDLYFSAGSQFSLRRNQDSFSYYDYNQVRAFSVLKYYFLYSFYLKLGTSWQYKNFMENDSWNHHEYSIWLQSNLSLPTRTALRFYIDYRNRDFTPYSYSLNGNEYSDEISTLWMLIARGRLAQAISDKIGIYSEYSYYYNPSEGNPFEVEIDSFSPIDDYFGYKGWSLENNLKYRFSDSFETDLNIEFYKRKYLNRPVYEYNFATNQWIVDQDGYYIINESNRLDHGYQIELAGNYNIERIFNKAANLNLEAYLYFQNNNSNDPYFEYDDYGAGVNIYYNFQW